MFWVNLRRSLFLLMCSRKCVTFVYIVLFLYAETDSQSSKARHHRSGWLQSFCQASLLLHNTSPYLLSGSEEARTERDKLQIKWQVLVSILTLIHTQCSVLLMKICCSCSFRGQCHNVEILSVTNGKRWTENRELGNDTDEAMMMMSRGLPMFLLEKGKRSLHMRRVEAHAPTIRQWWTGAKMLPLSYITDVISGWFLSLLFPCYLSLFLFVLSFFTFCLCFLDDAGV